MKLSVGTLITLITISLGIGGAYYTTINRIDNLETKVKTIQKKINKINKARAKS